MSRRLILSAAAALALVAPAARAAVIEFPDPASRSFIELFEIDSGRSLCNLTCSLVASPTASVTQAPFSLVGGPRNLNFVNAAGDVLALNEALERLDLGCRRWGGDPHCQDDGQGEPQQDPGD